MLTVLEILFYAAMFALGYFGLPYAEEWMRTWRRSPTDGHSCPACRSRDIAPASGVYLCRCNSCDNTWPIGVE